MPDLELARRDGVELIRTGRFQTLTGSWNPTPADIQAAVEAMDCPAIRKPVIRLGHTDRRFVGDGEPALGWFENLRAADGGHTLVADQVTLPWLNSVQAAAYPSRSIEGNYNHLCSEGHRHKFVIHTVALLGVTPPGVQTLRSLNDLPGMLGVAASGEVPEGAEHVQVTVMAADEAAAAPVHTGAMVALIPTAEDAERLAVDGGEPADQMHVTLAYLGEAAGLGAQGRQDVLDAVSTAANGLPVIDADVFAVSVFNPGDATDRDPCLVYGLSGDMLDAVHDLIDGALFDGYIDASIPSQHRPWLAHITAEYTGDLGRIAALAGNVGPVRFDRLRLAFGGEHVDIPLIDWPADEALPDGEPVAAADGDADQLHDYWTKGAGLAKWRGKPHPWTALFRELKKHLSAERAKRVASAWYLEVFGHTPNQKVSAAADESEPAQPIAPPGDPAPILPAAEPEPNTDPKEEDLVSDLSAFRSRLGLPDDADETAITAAIDELKVKADTPAIAEPTPEMVAASAAAVEQAAKAEQEKDELAKEVSVLASQVQSMSQKLADEQAEKAATVKASVIGEAARLGKFTPADKAQWEKDYDEAPGAITRVLASIAPGSAVPVSTSGGIGDPEPTGSDDDWADLVARLDGPSAKAV